MNAANDNACDSTNNSSQMQQQHLHSPKSGERRRRSSTKQFERYDFEDSNENPYGRRKSDSSILSDYSEYYITRMPTQNNSPEIQKSRVHNKLTIQTDSLNNSVSAPMSCPVHQTNTLFADLKKISEAFSPKSGGNTFSQNRRVVRPKHKIFVDEFDETNNYGNNDEKFEFGSSPENDSESINRLKEWESSPRKHDIHRQVRMMKDLELV
ncbi:hypothetical protein TRFO_04292 [Tritrichomonas foetus]|uniref:Uncharacterized protein n=1 Tax=Tritrichomonas foetus TaxID=1144522 RepID=A0A1J4KFS4_9EUKA|nr:hypothetical protein TRFO_04292 [Tritrichomonas foetus]|eukprot:OHT10271.1 hypothetical protein TRFO_04292 [Tritrichomonas foetus]